MTAIDPQRTVSPMRRQSLPSLATRLFQKSYAGALVSLVLVSILLSILEPVFLTWPNLMNIVKSNSVVFVLAIGATYVVIAGAIDLSVASATVASAMILGLLLVADLSAPAAIGLTLVFGAGLGAFNGFLISYVRISFFVVTLGTLSMFHSFSLVLNDGTSIGVFTTPGFEWIGTLVNGAIGPVPIILLFDLVLLALAGAVLRHSTFGRSIYAIGANAEAARLNGIDVKRVMFAVFVLAGLLAALGSVVQVGRLTSASAEVDPTLLLTVLAAVLIGGTAFTGGEGGVFGTAVGVLFLGVIQNGLTLSGVSSFWQGMVSGAILIFAVWLGAMREILRRRQQSRLDGA